MIQLYHGDGKGKTTAAVGICVRARGHNIPVVFAQFLKDGSSGEIKMLKQLGVKVMLPDTFFGFVRSMSEEQLQKTKEDYAGFLNDIEREAYSRIRDNDSSASDENMQAVYCVLVLDEVVHACNNGLVNEKEMLAFLGRIKHKTEVILTGRNPSADIENAADYCTSFQKEKHPFDLGVTARIGVEL